MDKKSNIMRAISLARPELRNIVVGSIFLFIGAGLNLCFPMLIGKLVDGITNGGGREVVNQYTIWLVGIFLIVGVSTFFRSYLFTVSGERIVARLRHQLFFRLVQQEIAFFDLNRTGALTNRLASDTTVLQKAVTVNLSMALRFALSGLGAIIILMFTSWKLTLLMLGVVPIVAIGAGFYGRALRRISVKVQDALAEATAIAEEGLSGIRTVRAFAKEESEADRYGEAVDVGFQLAKRRAFLGASFQGLVTFAGYAAICAVLWYGGVLLVDNQMAFGELTAFMLYTFTVAFSIGALSGLYEDFAKAIGASERIFVLLDRESELIDGDLTPETVLGELSFEQVSFSYPSRPKQPVLIDVNLNLSKGNVLALVGPSGSGKSTIAALTSRFYDPEGGDISLDGISLKRWSKDYLRSKIGVVSQEPILFATSVLENIRYGNPSADMEQVISAAKAANAHEFIQEFPESYQTMVGERGIRLSGGQKQRVAIARALLKDPKLLILDEATSALDAESEHLVQEALERLMDGRTTLVIAHRLSTIQDADQVAVLDQGSIVELGSHHALLEKQGLYKRLVERQFTN